LSFPRPSSSIDSSRNSSQSEETIRLLGAMLDTGDKLKYGEDQSSDFYFKTQEEMTRRWISLVPS
jgi:hypothetical protein